MRTKLLLWILLVASPGLLHGATNLPFRVGEKLTYQIYWVPFVGGKSTLEITGIEKVDGHDCFHIVAHAETTGFADFLFHIDSRTESWMDVDGLYTRRYMENRTEGKRQRGDDSLYDYKSKQLITTNFVTGRVHSYPLEETVQDMISCLYFVRTKPLQLDVVEKFPVVLGSTRYDVTIRPDERKMMSFHPTGNVPALRIEPSPTMAVVAKNNGRMWFWVSDDQRKLLLLITSDMKIGSAKFVLSQYKPGQEP